MRYARDVKLMVVVGLLGIMPAGASAVVMTFTYTGNGSGTLGGVPFPASDFIITGMGDTATRRSLGVGWGITHSSASIQIAGLGQLGFISGTGTWLNTNRGTVNLGRSPVGGDLFDSVSHAPLSTWDMLGPIGPITGQASLMQWSSTPLMNTTGGILIFNNGSCTETFTAIPEPATLALLCAAGVMATRRKRQAVASA